MNLEERALKVVRYLADHGYGDCQCSRCIKVGSPKPSTEILRALREARAEGIGEMATIAAIHSQYPIDDDWSKGYDDGRKAAAEAIRAKLTGEDSKV